MILYIIAFSVFFYSFYCYIQYERYTISVVVPHRLGTYCSYITEEQKKWLKTSTKKYDIDLDDKTYTQLPYNFITVYNKEDYNKIKEYFKEYIV